jgi:hypothetical protein
VSCELLIAKPANHQEGEATASPESIQFAQVCASINTSENALLAPNTRSEVEPHGILRVNHEAWTITAVAKIGEPLGKPELALDSKLSLRRCS